MKKIMLLTLMSYLFCLCTKAQSKNTNLNSSVETGRKANGAVLVHTEEGKYKVYASFKKRKVDSYYALDMAGKRIDVVYNDQGLGCFFCIKKDGQMICYDVDCKNIPPPMSQISTKMN